MKCEKCGQNEATFYYSYNLNGQQSEAHLCEQCAREAGFGGAMDWQPAGMLGGMFGGLFGDFFAPRRALPGAFDFFGAPMRAMMAPALPLMNLVVDAPQTAQTRAPLSETERKIPDDAGADVRTRREIAALRQQLDEAVRAEDFEKAIELRDQLKKYEA